MSLVPYAGCMNRDQIAEIIWRAEARRASGKERLVSWDDVSPKMKDEYLYLADAILTGWKAP